MEIRDVTNANSSQANNNLPVGMLVSNDVGM